MLEAEREGEAERTVAAVPSPAMAVPASLHASLMARLDRLGGSAKEVAQIGAAIGREFPHALIAAVARKAELELGVGAGPADSRQVYCSGRVWPRTRLICSNTRSCVTWLTEACCVTSANSCMAALLMCWRNTFRRRSRRSPKCWPITIVRPVWPTRQAHTSSALATALPLAPLTSRRRHISGQRSRKRIAYLRRDERARRALTLLLKLGPAIAVTIGEWKPEVEAVYRRAHDLGREVGDGPKLFRATWGLWLCASRTDNKQSRKWTEELTSLAQRLGDESLLLEAQHCRWGDEFYGGNVPRLLETSEEGIRRYDAKRHAQLADAFGGHDPGVCALVCSRDRAFAARPP